MPTQKENMNLESKDSLIIITKEGKEHRATLIESSEHSIFLMLAGFGRLEMKYNDIETIHKMFTPPPKGDSHAPNYKVKVWEQKESKDMALS